MNVYLEIPDTYPANPFHPANPGSDKKQSIQRFNLK